MQTASKHRAVEATRRAQLQLRLKNLTDAVHVTLATTSKELKETVLFAGRDYLYGCMHANVSRTAGDARVLGKRCSTM